MALLQEKNAAPDFIYKICNFCARKSGAFLKQRVNKRRQRRALRQDDEQAQQQHDKKNRAEPPFLAHAHKSPKFAENRQFAHEFSPYTM
jgi:hypothetical protein